MPATNSSPGPSTPGGELQQISPDAWPTATGGQSEHSLPAVAISPPPPAPINCMAEQLRDNWERVKGGLRKKYGELTDADLSYVEGQESALIHRLQQKTGRTRAEIEAALNVPE